MKAIVCVDENWGIGLKGDLLVRIPADQRIFREATKGNVIIYGRRTLDTFPNKIPLPERENVILSTKQDFKVRGAYVVHSIEEMQELIAGVDTNRIFVAGGEKVYEELLPLCDTVFVTKVDSAYDADAFFPNLDKMEEWEVEEESDEQTYFDMTYNFYKYVRKSRR